MLGLPNYYNPNILLWHIHQKILYCRFIIIIFYKSNILQLLDNYAIFTSFLWLPSCIFEYYCYRSIYLSEFCFYVYFTTILIIKYKCSSGQVFEFKESYPHKLNLIQRHYIKLSSDFFIALNETWSHCQSEEDTILDGHVDTIS